jgi:hypothetical protein
MRTSTASALLAACLITLPWATGCNSDNNGTVEAALGQSTALNDAPEIDPVFHSRKPRKCPVVQSPPNSAQAAALVQCFTEMKTRNWTSLMQNVSIQIGPSRPFSAAIDRGDAHIDPSARVITFTGSASQYMCMTVDVTNQGRSCNSKDIVNAAGTCFKTGAGYQCNLPAVGTGFHPYLAPPTTF